MKKLIVLMFFVLLLGNFFFLSNVYALEKTRVYGTAVPNSRISLLANYYANGKQYNQMLGQKADANGNWENTFLSDIGTIEFTLTVDGQSKKFSIPTGVPFFATFIEETPVVNVTNVSVPIETNVSINNTQETKSSVALSGNSVLEKIKEMDFGGWGILVVIIVLIIILVIANIFSSMLLRMWRIKKERSHNIKVVKLSDKMEEIKQREEQEKLRLQKEKEEQEKKERLDQIESEALQRKIKELEEKLQEKKSKDDLIRKIKELEDKLKEKQESS